MATIRRDVVLAAAPEAVWDVVRDLGAVHRRLAPGLVTDTTLEDGARHVTFAGGTTVRELIVSVDDAARRVAYAAVGGRAAHHNASMQVLAEGRGSRLVWITDLLPDAAAEVILPLIEQGAEVMRRTLDVQDGGAGPRTPETD